MIPAAGLLNRKQFLLMLAVVVMLRLCCCRSRQVPQTLTRVRIAVPDSSFSYLPVFIAQELGFYRDQGLDPTLQAVYGGGAKSMQAILGGSVDCAGISLELAIQLRSRVRQFRCQQY